MLKTSVEVNEKSQASPKLNGTSKSLEKTSKFLIIKQVKLLFSVPP